VTGDFTSPPLLDTDAWTGARLQQGRVLLDGDWNLNLDAAARERQQIALGTIGAAGVLLGSGGFQIGFAADGTLQIGGGTMWVGGLRAVNLATIAYSAQEAIAALPAGGQALIYLDAFVQELQPAEDPADLLDPALDGVDTTTRTRVAWRVRAVSLPTSGTAPTCASAASALPAPLLSTGLLDITATVPATPDPCAPPADPASVKLPDGLLRVEVLDSGTEGTARFGWSWENGSAAVAATVAGATVTLAPSPSIAFYQNDLVEVSTLQRRADRLDNGPLFTVTNVEPGAGGSVVTLSPASTITGTPSGLCLRRWDGQAVGAAAPVSATLAGADVGVTFTAEPGTYLAGDWWVTRVRGSSSGVSPLTAAPPNGTQHYVASLAVVDLGAQAVLSDCRPQYLPLTSITGGCCTLEIAPSDVSGGASLPALLAGLANSGPVTVCLAPGMYTLPAPIMLGSAFANVTLQGCDQGVVLQGPAAPGPEFTLGLIVIEGATSVTVRDMELQVPLVGFTPPAGAFASLPATNQELLGAYTTSLQVGIGIFANNVSGLCVENCAFSFPDPGGSNAFSAGVYTTGAMTGTEITGCSFQTADPPGSVPFYDLTVGNQTQPPYQLTFGYLQVANFPQPAGSGSASDATPQTLHDAVIERCLFQGLSVSVFALTEIGTLRIDRNTVRDCYGGFWLYSLTDPSQFFLDQIAIGDNEYFLWFSAAGAAAWTERITPVTRALAGVLPVTPPVNGNVEARTLATLGAEQLAQTRQRVEALLTPATTPGATAAAQPAEAAPTEVTARQEPGDVRDFIDINFPVDPGLILPTIPAAETGTSVIPRVDLTDCQVDAIVATSYSGAALALIDLTYLTVSEAASAIVHGNRLRSRFPGGETAAGAYLTEACVTGNIVANEAAIPATASAALPNSFSLSLIVPITLGELPVAGIVSGNVFIDPPVLSALENWTSFNTVINYSVVPTVTGISPPTGTSGTSVTVVGTGFAAATAVSFGTGNNANWADVTISSDFELSAPAPNPPAGSATVDITVTTPAGTSATSSADQFTYQS
jgi:hypothetical protein